MNNPYESETGCCPLFDPATLEEKELHWEDKLFIKDKVFCLFYMPMNFGKVVTRLFEKITEADAFTMPDPPLALSDHTSKWSMDLYIEVPKEVPGAENVKLSGDYLCKVYEGPYKDTGKWCDQMKKWVESKGKTIKKYLMYYTCCPKCAKHYGKNYVVIIAEV